MGDVSGAVMRFPGASGARAKYSEIQARRATDRPIGFIGYGVRRTTRDAVETKYR